MFSTEVAVYDRLLPRIRRLEKCCQRGKLVTPKHFYASADEGVIVMEDLRRDGYYMADKLAGTIRRILLRRIIIVYIFLINDQFFVNIVLNLVLMK
jgi:hypothetical protein